MFRSGLFCISLTRKTWSGNWAIRPSATIFSSLILFLWKDTKTQPRSAQDMREISRFSLMHRVRKTAKWTNSQRLLKKRSKKQWNASLAPASHFPKAKNTLRFLCSKANKRHSPTKSRGREKRLDSAAEKAPFNHRAFLAEQRSLKRTRTNWNMRHLEPIHNL